MNIIYLCEYPKFINKPQIEIIAKRVNDNRQPTDFPRARCWTAAHDLLEQRINPDGTLDIVVIYPNQRISPEF